MADGKVHKLSEVLGLSSKSVYLLFSCKILDQECGEKRVGNKMVVFRWRMMTYNMLRYGVHD